MQDNRTRPQVIEVRVKQSHGLLWFLLFGWWYVAYLALRGVTVAAWRLFVAWPWRATVAASRWSYTASRRFHARYGWRGWAIAGAVLVILAILGKITGN